MFIISKFPESIAGRTTYPRVPYAVCVPCVWDLGFSGSSKNLAVFSSSTWPNSNWLSKLLSTTISIWAQISELMCFHIKCSARSTIAQYQCYQCNTTTMGVAKRHLGHGFANFTKGSYLGLPDHLKLFQGHFVFQRDTVGYFHERLQWVRNGH